MTEIVHTHKRITSQVSEDGTSFVTKLTIDATELGAAGFAENDEVAVLLFVNVEQASSATEIKTQLTYAGTGLGPDSGLTQYDLGSSDRQKSYGWLEFVDLGATLGDFDLDLASNFATVDVFINVAELIIFRLADLGVEDVDWFRSKSTTALDHDSFFSDTSRASVTWTPERHEDWVVLGSVVIRCNNIAVNHEGRFALDGVAVGSAWTEEAESVDENKKWFWFDLLPNLDLAEHILSIETRDDVGSLSLNEHTQSNLLVFRKDVFSDLYVDETGDVLLPSDTDTQLATITDSFTVDQDAIILGQANADLGLIAARGFMWIRKDGTTVIDPVVDAVSDLAAVHLFDNTDDPLAAIIAAFLPLDEGAQDLDLFGHQTRPNRNYRDVKFMAWGLSLAGEPAAPAPKTDEELVRFYLRDQDESTFSDADITELLTLNSGSVACATALGWLLIAADAVGDPVSASVGNTSESYGQPTSKYNIAMAMHKHWKKICDEEIAAGGTSFSGGLWFELVPDFADGTEGIVGELIEHREWLRQNWVVPA